MSQLLLAFAVSLAFGILFGLATGLLGLPAPSPPTAAGLLAVYGSLGGIYFGVLLSAILT